MKPSPLDPLAALLAPLAVAVLLAAFARRNNMPAPLVLVVAGLAVGLIPKVPDITLQPDLVLFVILPPLLWSAGLESSYINIRRNLRRIGLLAIGLPLATTVAVGIVAYHTVPTLTLASAFTLGAIVAPPDAVSAIAVGRRVGLPRRVMTLLGGESLLNDATALTVYKVALGGAIGTVVSWRHGLVTFASAAVGGVAVGVVLGVVIVFLRSQLDDSLAESAIGLIAPFVIYLVAEQLHGSGVLAVVVAAMILGQRFTRVRYATRLQDQAVWRAVQLLLESFAFLLIGLQLPAVVQDRHGIAASTLTVASVAVFSTVLAVRIVWVVFFAYVPRLLSARVRQRGPAPTRGQVFVVAWAGMRGVVSLAAAFGVPMTTLAGTRLPGRSQLVFLTFVVVVGTLLLHGLTLPWLVRKLGVQGDEVRTDAIAASTAQDKAARAAADRLDEVLATTEPSAADERAVAELRGWNTRRRNSAQAHLRHHDTGSAAAETGSPADEIGSAADETTSATFRRLRLEMLTTERETFVAERNGGHIDDQVLRTALHGLDLEEATLDLD